VTLGQSLSQGATSDFDLRVLTNQPPNAQQLLTLDFGPTHNGALGWGPNAANIAQFEGFAPLVERVTETHVSGMMTALLASYLESGKSPPTLLHINNGAGGRSILQLMTSQSDIHTDLQSGISATEPRDVFAIPAADNKYDFFIRTVDGAQFQATMAGPLIFFDNIDAQLTLAVNHARSLGFDIAPKVVLNWIQGQSDSSPNYDIYLSELIENFNELVKSVVAPDASAAIVVSQTRGYGQKLISLDQLEVISQRDDVFFGASEFEYQVRFPIGTQGGGTHLAPEGYYVMGQRIGRNIFAALEGTENAAILIKSVTQTGARTLIVEFTGVDNHLVRDESIFSADEFIRPPSNMGFFAYQTSGSGSAPFQIANAEIISRNQVLLTFSSDITGEFLLMLGRTPEDLRLPGSEWGTAIGWGGTTLRDSGQLDALAPTDGSDLADPFLYEFAPIQSAVVRANLAPSIPKALTVRVQENRTHVTDLNASDDVDLEGQGLRYFIQDTLDGRLFDIHPLTGVLSFKTGPNFERPLDDGSDNRYQLQIGVSDSFNVTSYTSFTVEVRNANEAPTSININNDVVYRSSALGAEIAVLSGVDEDANTILTYSIVQQDANIFSIDSGTGALRISDKDALASHPQSSVRIRVQATDASRLFVQREFVIQLAADPVEALDYVGTESADVFTHRHATSWRAEGRGGDDRLTGSSLNDMISGGDGNDVLEGGDGDDRLVGGAGNDRLIGGPGVDIMLGGAGSDTYFVDHIGDQAIELDSFGNDSGGADRVYTTVSFHSIGFIERITGSGPEDIDINGSATNELIEGNSGNNRLFGAGGNDRIVGGNGDDLIVGGAGIDVMTGGPGADIFLFDSAFEAGDRITDFENGIDKIVINRDLLQGLFADGALDPALFAVGSSAKDADDLFIFNPSSRRLFFDPDGTGSAPQQEIAILSGVATLGAADILIGVIPGTVI